MFEGNKDQNGPNNETDRSAAEYLRLADGAKARGEADLAAHLYLVAYEKAQKGSAAPDAIASEALRRAWEVACESKERALAEYIFEKLEPSLTADEVSACAERLQRLALDKLEEFGFDRDEVREMAEMVSEDFGGAGSFMSAPQNPLRALTLGSAGHALPVPARSSESSSQKSTDTAEAEPQQRFSFKDLVGYDRAIAQMHQRGLGLSDDPRFGEFLSMLKERHGIDRPLSNETLIFRSFAREDADRFMAGVVGELNLPTVRMCMDENPQGFPVLCVMASPDFKSRLQLNRDGFTAPGVLMLEDIDLWGSPLAGDEGDAYSFSQLSRGAREAIALIRGAVDNPDVTVVASCSDDVDLEEFFYELLDPTCEFVIDVPDEVERGEVWKDAAEAYPSLRLLDRTEIVRMSANMSRYDIYLAAREAVEQAYKESLTKRAYVPVTRDNLFDKIAAYQPLDSPQYHEIEEAAVESLRQDLDDFEGSTEGES